MNLWKVLGLAGVAGVAAAGVIIARGQPQRAPLSPDALRARARARPAHAPPADPVARGRGERAQLRPEEIRARLHERLAEASPAADGASDPAAPGVGRRR